MFYIIFKTSFKKQKQKNSPTISKQAEPIGRWLIRKRPIKRQRVCGGEHQASGHAQRRKAAQEDTQKWSETRDVITIWWSVNEQNLDDFLFFLFYAVVTEGRSKMGTFPWQLWHYYWLMSLTRFTRSSKTRGRRTLMSQDFNRKLISCLIDVIRFRFMEEHSLVLVLALFWFYFCFRFWFWF